MGSNSLLRRRQLVKFLRTRLETVGHQFPWVFCHNLGGGGRRTENDTKTVQYNREAVVRPKGLIWVLAAIPQCSVFMNNSMIRLFIECPESRAS